MGEIENVMAIVSKTTALLLLCTAVIASGSRAPNPRPRRSGSGSGSGSGTSAPTSAPTLAPTLAPSATPTKYPTGAPANTPTNTPTVGYTAAATQITQTIVQTIPGVDSAATFNAEPNVKSAYEKGYGSQIFITDTASDGSITYKTGCSVDAYAADARRAAMNVQYSSVVSDASGVDTTTASNGVTDTASFSTAVATVVASDTATYSSVTAPSASDITSVSTTTSVSISGGTEAPTSGPSDDSSDMDTLVIILLVIGGLVLIGMIVLIVVRLRVADPKGADTEGQKSFSDLKSAQLAASDANTERATSSQPDTNALADTVHSHSDTNAQADTQCIGIELEVANAEQEPGLVGGVARNANLPIA